MGNQIPSASQIRAAMAMLKWENRELGEASSVSEKTIYTVKMGLSRPQPRVLSSIRKTLEDNGIEFTEQDGVRRRSESIQVLQGPEDFRAFYDIVYEHLKQNGGAVCVSGVDEKLFAKYQGDQHHLHIERMNTLTKRRDDIQVMILIREGDTNFTATSYASYRWQSRQSFTPTAFYVFGDCLALISFQAENAPKVILIRSAVSTAVRRGMGSGQTPPKEKSMNRHDRSLLLDSVALLQGRRSSHMGIHQYADHKATRYGKPMSGTLLWHEIEHNPSALARNDPLLLT